MDNMSWFDTAGLASFAKTALKEAQKQIDKALDIQDDSSTTNRKSGDFVINSDSASKTEPSTPSYGAEPTSSIPTSSTSVWGSFSGEESRETKKNKQNHNICSTSQVPTSIRRTTANRRSPPHRLQAPGSPPRTCPTPWTLSRLPQPFLRCLLRPLF